MIVDFVCKHFDRMKVARNGDLLQYRFENGLLLSCGIGRMHLCSSETMEVAVFRDGRFVRLLDDDVEGHVPRQLFAWLVRDLDDPNVDGALAQVRRTLERKHELV
jgi:hypothetical protein